MTQFNPPMKLNPNSFLEGVTFLTKMDADLAQIIAAVGHPPFWSRQPGFTTLIHIILEQQVSLASARAALDKLIAASDKLTPTRFLEFTNGELRAFGFSRQKTTYCRVLSQAILDGDLDLDELSNLGDSAAQLKLMQFKGIGVWTAEIYLLMALLRPDIWPSGDLALAKAVQQVKNLPTKPGPEKLVEIAEQWKPWRAVAARILWHFYLSK